MANYRGLQPLVRKSSEMSWAVPWVMGLRIWQFWLAGANPSAADKREWNTMFMEKYQAYYQAWWAMGMEAGRTWMKLCSQTPTLMTQPFNSAKFKRQTESAAFAIAHKGLSPVHKKVAANARRLSKK